MFVAVIVGLADGQAGFPGSPQCVAESAKPDEGAPSPTTAEELQQLIDESPPHATVACDRNRTLTISKPIQVRKSLNIQGLTARLADGIGDTPMVVVEAEGVRFSDFVLRGNSDSVAQSNRASALIVHSNHFLVENGRFENVSKNGLSVEPSKSHPQEISGGVVRNLVGDGVVRDVVSLSGGDGDSVVRDIVIENVRGYRSRLRGPVEVSDGARNITVRNVYAEECVYAVDIQDHGKPAQVNSNVLIDNVTAVRCKHAIRMSLHDFGHQDITLQNITAIDNESPLHLQNAERLRLSNARVLGCESAATPLILKNCRGAVVRDVYFRQVDRARELVQVEHCDHVVIDGIICREAPALLRSVIGLAGPASDADVISHHNLVVGKAKGAVPDIQVSPNE